MLLSTKLVLLTIVVAVSGKADDDKIERISSVIEKTGSALQSTKNLIESSSPDFGTALKVVQEFADLGSIFFPELKIFSASIGLLSGLIGGGESTDDKIMKGLSEIKDSINHVEQMINGLVPQIRKDMIKQRFIQNIQTRVNDMQRLYNDFAQRPNKPMKEALIDQCRGNAMKNVLTEIHNELVNGGEGNYNELLDGGERHEMKEAEKWSKAFQGLYMQASFLRSVCFPLMRTEQGWEDDLASQMDGHKKDFQEINEVIKKKLLELKNNYMNNAKKSLEEYFGMDKNWSDWGWQLMINVYSYLNDNFNPGDGLKWNVIVLPEDYINHIHDDFARVTRRGWAVFAQYGRLSVRVECNEWYIFVGTKYLYCQKIAGNKFNYKPVPDGKLYDTHEQDGYVDY